jgi:uncharacterized membrane protein
MSLVKKIGEQLSLIAPYQGETPNYSFSERLTAAASYLPLVAPAVLLFNNSNSNFVKFHAKHAFVFSLLAISSFFFSGWLKLTILLVTLPLIFLGAYQAWNKRVINIPFLTGLLNNFDV